MATNHVDARDATNGSTALWRAAEVGDEAAVEDLIARGADVEARDRHGYASPLLWACSGGHLACARALLAAGAEPDGTAHLEKTPLHRAAGYGHTAVLRLLLQHGAAVNALARSGVTPLMEAAGASGSVREECVAVLLEAGADTGLQDDLGQYALSLAASLGAPSLVQLLLRHGADPDIRVGVLDGLSIEDWCREQWRKLPGAYLAVPEEQREAALGAIRSTSVANALWRRRRVMLMLQARRMKGEDITAALTPSHAADARLRDLVMWVLLRQDHGTQLFRLITMFL
ncbi:unnamed protein product [Chrysoparadoxa australica]